MTGDAFAVAELGGCVGINCAVFLAGSLQLFGCVRKRSVLGVDREAAGAPAPDEITTEALLGKSLRRARRVFGSESVKKKKKSWRTG